MSRNRGNCQAPNRRKPIVANGICASARSSLVERDNHEGSSTACKVEPILMPLPLCESVCRNDSSAIVGGKRLVIPSLSVSAIGTRRISNISRSPGSSVSAGESCGLLAFSMRSRAFACSVVSTVDKRTAPATANTIAGKLDVVNHAGTETLSSATISASESSERSLFTALFLTLAAALAALDVALAAFAVAAAAAASTFAAAAVAAAT